MSELYDPTGGHDARLAGIQNENQKWMHHWREELADSAPAPLCPLPPCPTWPPMANVKNGREGSK